MMAMLRMFCMRNCCRAIAPDCHFVRQAMRLPYNQGGRNMAASSEKSNPMTLKFATSFRYTDAENNLAPVRCSASYSQAYRLFLRPARLGAESGNDRHVNMNRLIRNNCE